MEVNGSKQTTHQSIQFSRAKKDDLPSVASYFYVRSFSTNNPMAGEILLTKDILLT